LTKLAFGILAGFMDSVESSEADFEQILDLTFTSAPSPSLPRDSNLGSKEAKSKFPSLGPEKTSKGRLPWGRFSWCYGFGCKEVQSFIRSEKLAVAGLHPLLDCFCKILQQT
jgi:hypothetical protein